MFLLVKELRMLTVYQIRLLIDECRKISSRGLLRNLRVTIPHLEIDIVLPHEFLGVHNNPAIFVNSITFKQLKKHHSNWIENKTLVFKKSFLQEESINIIGAVIHETGHAFNVAANIPNTEANAYIYEIEVMRALLANASPLLFGCSVADIQVYFKKRLPFYHTDPNNKELQKLITLIKTEFNLEEEKAKEEEEEEQVTAPLSPQSNLISFLLKSQPSLFSNNQTQEQPLKTADEEAETFTP